MYKFKRMSDIDVSSRTASTSWGIPPRLIALVLSLFLHAVHPQIPLGQVIGSHLWLPATPSLFHAHWVDSRIWRS